MSADISFLAPSVGFGLVAHHRHQPCAHGFHYPVAFLRMPLSAWDRVRVPLLGVDRAHVFSLNRRDHGPRDGSDLARWIGAVLRAHRLTAACDGEVVLQTFPRMFGYVFNPVSFWFCHDRGGALRAVLAEVNNTFGERHGYLVAHEDGAPIRAGEELTARKCFHVSPFFPVSGEYRFRFVLAEGCSRVHVDLWAAGQCQLSTVIDGRLEPLARPAMWRWLGRFPFMTLGVMVRIHLQAFRLWRKRVRFFRKPLPPVKEIST
ncbi:DUF1365 domain-containing protein [Nitrogeniibacter mangrovi]|uniref:DUF1365 domain-containing protein n=1 Tax=Nitrogeniibacter mangrovi TaxID=2016596 RepID=A0A6C1B0E1_9RHOO|nr:DUF1365 domain-containing protein [Nitrogeniibacter mangrovi]QID17076.1 DUF1365 domain-containing protein [Nitrogeniibacter mangrovi]